MPRAATISVSKLNAAVEAAVKAAVQKHPKFKLEAAPQLALSYLIWGIPVPEGLAANLTIRETQGFATDIAGQLGGALPSGGVEKAGALFVHGPFLIVGIPAPPEVLFER